jgi:uncharacterized membrane protein YhiD involved in acid resistance
VAAIGMAAGAGMLIMAAVGTVMILIVLAVLDRVEELARRRMGIGAAPPAGDDGATDDLS